VTRQPDFVFNYKAGSALVPISSSLADFFTNPYLTECGVIDSCTILNEGCQSPYTGGMIFNTGVAG